MFFSLFNTLASFQSYSNMILAKKMDLFVIIYLDHIIIYTNKKNQIYFVSQVFKQLTKYLLYINWKNLDLIEMK